MKNLRIIEDASPYFVIFTFDGIEKLIADCKEVTDTGKNLQMYSGIKVTSRKELEITAHVNPDDYDNDVLIYHITEEGLKSIKEYLPWKTELSMPEWKGRIFRTGAGYKHVIHKDRANYGLNFMMDVRDDKCITTFYDSDEEVEALNDVERMKELQIIQHRPDWDSKGTRLRETSGIDDSALAPSKTFIAPQGVGILFNTEIYHNWFNNSDQPRTAIYMRPGPNDDNTFDFAKVALFGDLLK